MIEEFPLGQHPGAPLAKASVETIPALGAFAAGSLHGFHEQVPIGQTLAIQKLDLALECACDHGHRTKLVRLAALGELQLVVERRRRASLLPEQWVNTALRLEAVQQ